MPNKNEQCANCNDRYFQHENGGQCRECGCRKFIGNEALKRANFRHLLRWSKKWLKAKRSRNIKRFKEIWVKIQEIGYLRNCTCGASIIARDSATRTILRRDEGLSCEQCGRCNNCCKCVICETCRKYRRADHLCQTCKQCLNNNCCVCLKCSLCNKLCAGDYCHACRYCNKCCACGWENRVPFITQKPKFHKSSLKQRVKNPTERFIAAEIEVARIRGNGKPIYELVRDFGGCIVYDGSLPESGFEINTAPASGDLFVNQINEICAELKKVNAAVTNRCGLHIHVDARDYSYYDIRRLVKVYAAIEWALFSMVPEERQISRYCKPCGGKFLKAIANGRIPYDKLKKDLIGGLFAAEPVEDVRRNKHHPSRYTALNLHSWFYRGTIESRVFNGTVDANDIINWGIIWAMILDYSLHNTDEYLERHMKDKPFACLFKIVKDNQNVVDFIRNRVIKYGSEDMQKQMVSVWPVIPLLDIIRAKNEESLARKAREAIIFQPIPAAPPAPAFFQWHNQFFAEAVQPAPVQNVELQAAIDHINQLANELVVPDNNLDIDNDFSFNDEEEELEIEINNAAWNPVNNI